LSLTIGITTPSALASNRVLSLDGYGDYVEIPHHESISPDEQVTVEIWVKPAALTLLQGLVFKKNDGPEPGITFFEEYALFLSEGRARWMLGKSFSTNTSALSLPLSVEQWIHLAGTYDGAELRLYVNGLLQATIPWVFGIENSANPLTLGRAYGGVDGYTENYFTGKLDEVRIWNIARTQEEIQTTMDTTLTGQEEGLVGYWNFDDGVANDLSPNSNDGTLYGDARIVEENLPDEFMHKGVNEVVLEDKIANPGDQFTTNISVRSADNLSEGLSFHSFKFDLTFDPSVLKVISIKEGPFLSRDGVDATSWQLPTIDNQNGVVSNIRCSRTGNEGIGEKGLLATVTFEAAEMGYTVLSIQNLRLLSPGEEVIKASAKKGKVKVYPHGSISGVVLNAASEEPIKGARVEVSKGNFAFGIWTHSADDGTYILNGVSVGDFDVTASKDDYMSETISKVHIEQAKNTPDINIKLRTFLITQTITIKRPIAVGKTAPDFTLRDIDGKQVSRSNFTGKPTILNFWDRTSEHCLRQIEHLDALNKKYQGDGLVVIGINKELAHAAVLEFASSQISYTVLLDGAKAFQDYGVSGIPCTYYIDKTGKVRYRDVGFPAGGEARMEQQIKELLEDL